MLKLRVPLARGPQDAVVTAEVPYGWVSRPASGAEEPMQRWIDVAGLGPQGDAGLGIANDSLYGYAADGDGVGVTVARSVPYAHHEPVTLRPGQAVRLLDRGERRVRLRLLPHGGDPAPGAVTAAALGLNQPLTAVRDTYHDGDLPGCWSFGEVSGTAVSGVVLKRAEDGDATIVRVAEVAGTGGTATLRLRDRSGGRGPERRVDLVLGPLQVATVRLHDDGTVEPVDLCEWAEGQRPPGQPTPDGRPRLPEGAHRNEDP
jgi:alpha-mannosidase